ncbi:MULTISPECIES: DUF7144 family membrane protein [Streptomyces]|uniref:DUF7144 domain-containing protein n=2 Tax=Streptomyces TaxID=1883 RepID=A0A0W7X6B3_9ACTN|nr:MULTISPECIES: hypothetical protein [Streptomyces]KUF18258.1 hypothetical protein AT728_25165 [Streptomyces silvensis]MVO88141.1 hypothetical protein [Streptomyces typhae]
MAEQTSPGQTRHSAPEAESPRVRPLALGGVVFAVCVLAIIGSYHAIVGLAAIIDDDYYVTLNNYIYEFDITAWGWFHLLSGIVILAAAFTLFSGRVWARAVGMTVAGLSALENFFFTPYAPVWSAIIIALDILVIWSLAMYGRPVAHKVYGAPM